MSFFRGERTKWILNDFTLTEIHEFSSFDCSMHRIVECHIYSGFRNHPDESILLDGWLHKHWIRTCLDGFVPTLPRRCNFSGFYRTWPFFTHVGPKKWIETHFLTFPSHLNTHLSPGAAEQVLFCCHLKMACVVSFPLNHNKKSLLRTRLHFPRSRLGLSALRRMKMRVESMSRK